MAEATFTSPRVTTPDWAALLASLRTAVNDPAAAFVWRGADYRVKKTTAFTAPELAATQTAIDSAPALTVQRSAQSEIDAMSIFDKARDLTLIDQLNVIRAALPTPLPAITPAQAFAAIRTKAGTL